MDAPSGAVNNIDDGEYENDYADLQVNVAYNIGNFNSAIANNVKLMFGIAQGKQDVVDIPTS